MLQTVQQDISPQSGSGGACDTIRGLQSLAEPTSKTETFIDDDTEHPVCLTD